MPTFKKEQKNKRHKRLPPTNRIRRYVRLLLNWYVDHCRVFTWREDNASLYELVLAEFFLQRTRAETVSEFLPSFIEHFPDWAAIAASNEDELREYVACLGLWQSRVPSLLGTARVLMGLDDYPEQRSRIEELPGVGQYIANAIELHCLGVPRPLLDATMARCLERYFGERELSDIRFDPYLQALAQRLVEQGDPVRVNWAVLDFGANVCKKQEPICEKCPMNITCKWHLAHRK